MAVPASWRGQTMFLVIRRYARCAAALGAVGLAAAAAAQANRPLAINDLITAVRVADPQLSPDGRTVVFVRTTTDTSAGRRNADIWAVPADGSSAPRELITGDKTENTPRYSPDGRRLAFISTRDGAAQVYVADAGGGNITQVTRMSEGVQGPLVFSPDGTKIAFVSDVHAECRDEACNRRMRESVEKDPVKVRRLARLMFRHWDEWRERVRHHIFVADVNGGDPRDLSVADFRFAPDGSSIWFTAEDRAATNLYVVPVTGGPPKQIARGGAIGAFQPSARFVIFSKSALTAPAEIYRVATEGGPVTALTRENRTWLEEVALSAPENLTTSGAGGAPIQYWLLKPANFTPSRKYPVVFIIHG